MKFAFIAKHRGIWAVAWLCEALGVSRSGFHAWLTPAPSRRALRDDEIGAKVRAKHVQFKPFFGRRLIVNSRRNRPFGHSLAAALLCANCRPCWFRWRPPVADRPLHARWPHDSGFHIV